MRHYMSTAKKNRNCQNAAAIYPHMKAAKQQYCVFSVFFCFFSLFFCRRTCARRRDVSERRRMLSSASVRARELTDEPPDEPVSRTDEPARARTDDCPPEFARSMRSAASLTDGSAGAAARTGECPPEFASSSRLSSAAASPRPA